MENMNQYIKELAELALMTDEEYANYLNEIAEVA